MRVRTYWYGNMDIIDGWITVGGDFVGTKMFTILQRTDGVALLEVDGIECRMNEQDLRFLLGRGEILDSAPPVTPTVEPAPVEPRKARSRKIEK